MIKGLENFKERNSNELTKSWYIFDCSFKFDKLVVGFKLPNPLFGYPDKKQRIRAWSTEISFKKKRGKRRKRKEKSIHFNDSVSVVKVLM